MKGHHAGIEGYLDGLTLTRLGPERDAGLCVCSVPLPRSASADLGSEGLESAALPLGQWYDVEAPSPRRFWVASDCQGPASESLQLGHEVLRPDAPLPKATMRVFEASPDELFFWEHHSLSVTWGGQNIELVMGLRHGGEVRWWEA